MSNFNYMDKVPVKIAESYKPPPKLYQLPQALVNKLQLPVGHYNEAPQYCYDFQLERKVLAKMPEWRRLRQQERDRRRERKEQREQEHLHEVEARNKQLLGAVSYPSTDDLSSSDSDSNEKTQECQKIISSEKSEPDAEARLILSSQINSFDNILQPTIINRKFEKSQKNTSGSNLQNFAQNAIYSDITNDGNAFNYKDFEEDTSSPFDNIELKTINDLDILAQVLHNTQLHMHQKESKQGDNVEQQKFDVETEKSEKDSKELKAKKNTLNIEASDENATENDTTLKLKDKPSELNLEILEKTKSELRKVDFGNLYPQSCYNESIPNAIITNNSIANDSNILVNTSYNSYSNSQQQSYQTTYRTLYNGISDQQYTNFSDQTHGSSNISSNRIYLYPVSYNSGTSIYHSPKHLSQTSFVNSANNASSYENTISSSSGIHLQNWQQNLSINSCNDSYSKSKSVPDILAELSDEVRNSEIRRSRYYSFNSEEGKQTEDRNDIDEDITPKQSPVKTPKLLSNVRLYEKLPRPAQRLVKNISTMGFPLEQVARISTIFGTDDKKIIEHLISLSELMDLGFDETKISDALVKFDNNKEKALEYLIS